LQRAKDNGKGAILWESGYFGRRFFMKQILRQHGFPVHQVYGENHAAGFYTPCPASWVRRRVITRFFDNCEKQYVAEILALPLWAPLPVVRVLFERLKRNGIICTAGDGTLGWNSMRKKFLGGERFFYYGHGQPVAHDRSSHSAGLLYPRGQEYNSDHSGASDQRRC
jgi:hypothetical protein